MSLGAAIADAQLQLGAREAGTFEGERGFYLQFDIPVEHRDALDGLAQPSKGIEIVAVQLTDDGDGVVRSTVFVPEQAANHFVKKVEQYRDAESRSGQPKNQKLVASIDDVRLGGVRAIFTDDMILFPMSQQQAWWEVWIREDRLQNFLRGARSLEIRVKEHALEFIERTVVLALATPEQLQILIESNDAVAELRVAKDMPSFFLEMGPREVADWARDLAGRIQVPGPNAPAVCILDSGATRAHPVLATSLAATDQHTYDPTWGVGDSTYWNGHGTAMCGVALLGDVHVALMQAGPVQLGHRLETVKILPPQEQNDPALYGSIVAESVTKVEKHMPRRRRVYCMAVSSEIGLNRGRPSAWSAAIDEICFGGGTPRLMVTAAGNLRQEILAGEYPAANDLAEAENPSQAWNALVVGAYTDKITITHEDYFDWIALAPAGELSPASRTSTVWDKQWPIRPDVVFEGGNFGHDGVNPASAIDDLQSLTTHYRPQSRLFQTFGDTSGATALCANMAALIMAARPELRPETVRGLIVHSAEWTPAMRARFDQANFNGKRSLLRRYGWGAPNVDRALMSAATDATLMVEDTLKPFRIDGTHIKSRHMNLHQLPWPRDELLALRDHAVELRVTLSYFVEPNPGERGWNKRHKYASHGLRFAVKRALEWPSDFQRRINKAAEIEEQGQARVADQGGGDGWVLGTLRDRGSIHSDIWRGTAADLATRDAIAVYPVGGWWKEKRDEERRWDRTVRYALLVSIRAAGADTDIYSPIATQIGIGVPAA